MSDKASEVDELEQLFADADAMPIQISYALIKSITKIFAQVLGNGAFGVVYLGGLRNGMVAVKKLSISMDFSDTQFLEEVKCLKRVRHKNIVRFLGYCADTHGEVMEIEGKLRIVEVQQRLLCFEYVPNGSLHQCLQEKTHGYDWNTCYRIIKGICQGLHFLHEERISHLDLKPANVLLGAHMEPKITDFGLSRLLDGNQSTIFTMNLFGTPGYIAPELIDKQKISLKSDIFSLGIIIERLLTGIYENITETWLESLCVECKKMKRCLEISEKCANSDPSKIPTVDEITLTLNQTATTIQRVPPVVTDPRNDLTSSLYKWLKSQCVDCRQRKRCLQIAEKCADSDLSERPTVEKIFHMLNETQTTTQRIPSTVNEPRNDPRSSLYQWLKSLCVDCKRKKESLEIAEKSANPDPSKRPSRDDIIGMLNETETTIRKVLGVVDEPINHPRSSLYEWLKSQCVECNQKKGFLETVEKCAISDPGKIPSIAELILMLNETETTIPKIHPVVREWREDTKSSLYQWLQSLCVDCRDVKRCLETAEKFSNPGPSEGPNVENIFLILNEAQTPPKVAGVKDINNTKSSLYQWLESLGVDSKQMKRWLEISDCTNSDPSERPTMAEITLMHNEIETTIPKVSPDVNELENDARELYKWLQSLCVYFKRLKRCVEITKMCADRDPSKRPTVEEMFLMLNGTQTMRQKVLPVATAPRNDTRSSLYRWLESLCVDCNEKKRFLEIAEKFANFDGPKRPTVDEINVMLNKPETMFPKVPRNDQQSIIPVACGITMCKLQTKEEMPGDCKNVCPL
ncbi:serine/threonine-protein kinase Nek11-like isoform X1 [Panicum virgatum]|uniref:non-specific serine/threonine protein kinase n=1 Tax=Panicum virgatum TaxID=38727 RepID=A0A8T0P4R3_PANVG|nr:serine/threonine-protein kinase Nek11-like isoform X1 [Panicum virgatum]XP_039823148.1 serine/threonine-protein kinase Nek11-like isoform X1 [Panicum virgatum]XP_039823149.1 serine/threonine-protein kinase Nek11-like isoform X1 [Panicum virgatum]KAG2556763.1 hypothetical protein PVAP13_8NG190800 [Panicum virgatum]